MSSSSQASVYNCFDLCTVYFQVEGFEFRGKFRIIFRLRQRKMIISVIIVNLANFWCFTRYIVSV